MSPNTPELSDFKVTNYHYLRLLCIQKMHKEPSAEWSIDELEAMGDMLAAYAAEQATQRKFVNDDWRENVGLLIMSRDMDELTVNLPKWAMLQAWLTPESVAGYAPELVAKITKLALSGQLHLHRK